MKNILTKGIYLRIGVVHLNKFPEKLKLFNNYQTKIKKIYFRELYFFL